MVEEFGESLGQLLMVPRSLDEAIPRAIVSDCFAPAISSNVIMLMELDGSTRDIEIYTGLGHGTR
jgi:hypothetical protein